MKIEATGTILIGICSVKTTKCVAKLSAEPITAVWVLPERTQIKVCGACLAEQLRAGEWSAEVPKGLRPPLDLASLEYTVRMAKEPRNQGMRSDTIRFLREEIAKTEVEWDRHPSLAHLRIWLAELEKLELV